MAEAETKKPVKLPDNFDPSSERIKKKINPKADAKNVIDVRKNGAVLLCGATRKGKLCRQLAGHGTPHLGHGRCKYHGGLSTGPKTPEGKAKNSQAARKHGLYSNALNARERAVFEELLAEKSVTLTHEIMLLKAKLVAYLEEWKAKWERHYADKLADRLMRLRCQDCGKEMTRNETSKKDYCGHCSSVKRLVVLEYFGAERSEQEAREYADAMTRVFFKEGENGSRSYYHAGTVEDQPFMRSLDQLRRLVDSHAKLTQQDSGSILDQINAELRAASQVKATASWGGQAVRREGEDNVTGEQSAQPGTD